MSLTSRLTAIAAGCVALGCLGTSTTQAPRLFVLDATIPEATAATLDVSIGVGPISMPQRLDRPQILTRTTDYEINLAEFDQWAEPLDRSFPRAVAENLARAIPTDRVAVYPWSRGAEVDWKFEIDVTRFEREADGSVTLAARWRLIAEGERETIRHGASTFRETPEQATTRALVSTLSRLVGELSREMAAAIPGASPSGASR